MKLPGLALVYVYVKKLCNPSIQMLKSPAGYTAAQLFGQGTTYTYDDVIFLPGHINFGAHEASMLAWSYSHL